MTKDTTVLGVNRGAGEVVGKVGSRFIGDSLVCGGGKTDFLSDPLMVRISINKDYYPLNGPTPYHREPSP